MRLIPKDMVLVRWQDLQANIWETLVFEGMESDLRNRIYESGGALISVTISHMDRGDDNE